MESMEASMFRLLNGWGRPWLLSATVGLVVFGLAHQVLVAPAPAAFVGLLVDDDSFTITSTADGVEVEYGDTSSEPDLVVRTDYEGFLDAGEGRISLDEFAARHLEIVEGAAHADAFFTLMGAAMSEGR